MYNLTCHLKAGSLIPAFFFVFITILNGCSGGLFDRGKSVLQSAQSLGWETVHMPAGRFTLFGLYTGTKISSDTLHVYIEGDGLAWLSRSQPSIDPTPDNPLALRMALAVKNQESFYFARPCQFLSPSPANACDVTHWTSARFGTAVVVAYEEAIKKVLYRTQKKKLILIGYSGGGVLAALLASRLPQATGLITVASPIDHRIWTGYHKVTPLYHSLDLAKDLQKLSYIRQVHYTGEHDEIVPSLINKSFYQHLSQHGTLLHQEVSDQSHNCCWSAIWPLLIKQAVGYISVQ